MDPQVAQLRFSSLSEENEAPLWSIKLVGDNQPYNLISGDGTESYATVVLKNTNWPGSVTVAHFGSYASMYIGFGMKAGGNSFMPIQPPDVMDDPQEPKEQPEVRRIIMLSLTLSRIQWKSQKQIQTSLRGRRKKKTDCLIIIQPIC